MSRRGRKLGRASAIAALVVTFLVPVVFMFLGSLQTPGQPPPDGFDFIPEVARWDNYESVGFIIDIWKQMRNSLIVVVVAVPLTVLIASLAGFTIVTGSRRMRAFLLAVSVIALMVPATALWVPRFVMFKWLGVIDTLWALMVPALMATSPFYVLVFALAYFRIPTQLYEAARVEGLSPLRTWATVAWPLARPAAFAVAMLAFVFHWSNFIDALLYVAGEERQTIPLGLRALQTLEPTLHPLMLAGAAIATVPSLLAFLIGQQALFARTLEVR
ncbi:MAG: carbohydrate ABC transporter permease [Actinomycetota bacterium]